MSTELKVCSKCHLELPVTKFSVVDKASGRRRAHCNDCESARVRAYYAANTNYRERCLANSQSWAKRNPERLPAVRRKAKLKADYNLTPEQFDQLLAVQNGKCALCGVSEHGRKPKAVPLDGSHNWLEESWPVDHDHQIGHVRGLLCHPCNVQLGGYEVLLAKVGEARLLEYLTSPSPVLSLPIPELVPDVRATARFVAELPPRYVSHTCSVEGCDGPCHGGGFCFKHYMRARRRGGDTELAGPTTGAGHHKSTLTESQAREIKFSTEKGADLARKFAVKPSVISSIRHGHTWKHLEPETMQ